jgi:hypothetical protein
MTYALLAHVERWWAEPASGAQAPRRYVLIDAGQLPATTAVRHWLSRTPSSPLFKNCFAEAALALSPILIALDACREIACQAIEEIDTQCQALPLAAILVSGLTEERLVNHLQQRMRMEADGALYLLRFADTQMLQMTAQCFTTDQAATFFDDIDHWWVTDHHGACIDLVSKDRLPPVVPLPLKFDGEQTAALLDSAAVPITDARLSRYDPQFAALAHSRRMALLHQWRRSFEQSEHEDDEEDFMIFAASQWNQCEDRCK